MRLKTLIFCILFVLLFSVSAFADEISDLPESIELPTSSVSESAESLPSSSGSESPDEPFQDSSDSSVPPSSSDGEASSSGEAVEPPTNGGTEEVPPPESEVVPPEESEPVTDVPLVETLYTLDDIELTLISILFAVSMSCGCFLCHLFMLGV